MSYTQTQEDIYIYRPDSGFFKHWCCHCNGHHLQPDIDLISFDLYIKIMRNTWKSDESSIVLLLETPESGFLSQSTELRTVVHQSRRP